MSKKNPKTTKPNKNGAYGFTDHDIEYLLDNERCQCRFYKRIGTLEHSSENIKCVFDAVVHDAHIISSMLVNILRQLRSKTTEPIKILQELQKFSGSIMINTMDTVYLLGQAEEGPFGDSKKMFTFLNTFRTTLDLISELKQTTLTTAVLKMASRNTGKGGC